MLDTTTDDGRRIRRDRNRDTVVDAMLDLYRAGNLAPSSDEIAERAGVSPRSVFRYFEDIDDLCRVAITHHLERLRPFLAIDVDVDAPFGERVAAIVDQRLRLFEAISSVGQVSRLRAPFQPLIAAELAQGRSYLRRHIKRLFGVELATFGAQRAAGLLASVDALCSFESYQLMRYDQMLSRTRVGAALTDALTRLLTPENS